MAIFSWVTPHWIGARFSKLYALRSLFFNDGVNLKIYYRKIKSTKYNCIVFYLKVTLHAFDKQNMYIPQLTFLFIGVTIIIVHKIFLS